MAERTCDIPGCDRTHRARGFCSTHYNQLVIGERRRHPRETKACAVCGARVVRRRDNDHVPTCSVRCRSVVQFGPEFAPRDAYQWMKDAATRASKAGAPVVELFDRAEIFERDGWTCQLCGIQCTPPDPFDLGAATVDHVIPLAAGGEHSRRNAQTLCLSCNSAKQAGISPAA